MYNSYIKFKTFLTFFRKGIDIWLKICYTIRVDYRKELNNEQRIWVDKIS